MFRVRQWLKIYSVPAVVIVGGFSLWMWGYGGIAGLVSDDAADLTALGAGILSGGIVAAAVVWTEHQQSVRQEELALRQQISLQSTLVGIDCSHSALDRIYLSGKDLSHGQFVDADLTGAVAYRTKLASANLSGARLNGARVVEASFEEANMTGVHAVAAYFSRSSFRDTVAVRARFVDCDFTESVFLGCNAAGALFLRCELSPDQISQFSVPPTVQQP